MRFITGDVAERIRELDAHSQEIGRILEVIDDMAEQRAPQSISSRPSADGREGA